MMQPRNVGELILRRLAQLGVSHFFANPGTEFVSVIRGFRDLPAGATPEPVLAAHEMEAVCMAYGAYTATGRLAAVMTHANVGAANALLGLIAASRMNVPILFFAGATSASEHGAGRRDKLIHWAQEEAISSAREYVKWEAELRDPAGAHELLDRAYAIAMSEPRGPVLIRVARDTLVREDVPALPDAITVRAATPPAPDQAELASLLDRLRVAERPLLVTNRAGARTENAHRLLAVSERHALSVLTPDDYYLSFPHDNPLHLGFSQAQALKEADLVICLDADAPWFPLDRGPSDSAFVAHVGPDPLCEALSVRGHRGDLFLRSGVEGFLRALDRAPSAAPELRIARRAWAARVRPAAATATPSRLNAAHVAEMVAATLGPRGFLVNELGLPPARLGLTRPGSYFRSGASSPLGWGVGFALGAALADPGRTPVVVVGDGVALLSPLLAALASASGHGLPFVLVVLNNGGYRSVAATVSEFYCATPAELPLTRFPPNLAFDRCADFVNGHGARVEHAHELSGALAAARAFTEKNGRPAILNVILENA